MSNIDGICNLLATLEKIYSDREMWRWGCANDYRCYIEGKRDQIYELLNECSKSNTKENV